MPAALLVFTGALRIGVGPDVWNGKERGTAGISAIVAIYENGRKADEITR